MSEQYHSIAGSDVRSVKTPHVQRPSTITLDPRVDMVDLLDESVRIERVLDGFALIAKQASPRVLGMIGVGNGIEMIGAAHLFRSLDWIILADRDASLLLHAGGNVRNNAPRGVNVELRGGTIDLRSPLATLGRKVDLLYVNLLNAPFSEAPDAVIGRDAHVPPVRGTAEDEILNGYLLALPYHFLRSLPEVLNPGGSALMLIASRFPFTVLERLAAAAGVRFEELVCDLGYQADEKHVIPAFAAAERDDFPFFFYDHARAREARHGREHPTTGGNLAQCLAPSRLTARAADDRLYAGAEIACTYHLLRATPIG
jgi:SAM-dependent methyltransferase